LAQGVGAANVAIHNGAVAVWISARMAASCRDSGTVGSSFFFTQVLQPGGYFFQCFG
jgi:hypothetical protein